MRDVQEVIVCKDGKVTIGNVKTNRELEFFAFDFKDIDKGLISFFIELETDKKVLEENIKKAKKKLKNIEGRKKRKQNKKLDKKVFNYIENLNSEYSKIDDARDMVFLQNLLILSDKLKRVDSFKNSKLVISYNVKDFDILDKTDINNFIKENKITKYVEVA